MTNHFEISLSDWRLNAGILGFIRVIGRESIQLKNNHTLLVTPEMIDRFSERYFDVCLEDYFDQTSCFQMNRILKYWMELDSSEAFDDIPNQYIDGLFSERNSSVAARMVYNTYLNVLDMHNIDKKEWRLWSQSLKQAVKKKDVKQIQSICINIFKVLNGPYKREFQIAALKNEAKVWTPFIEGISLFGKVKTTNYEEMFRDYFIQPVKDWFKTSSEKGCCPSCNNRLVSEKYKAFSYLVNAGVDINKKQSMFWDLDVDLRTCELCRLFYVCEPLGFIKVGDKGWFLNADESIDTLVRMNEAARFEYRREQKERRSFSSFGLLVKAFSSLMQRPVRHRQLDYEVITFKEYTSYSILYVSDRLEQYIRAFHELLIQFSTQFYEKYRDHRVYIVEQMLQRVSQGQYVDGLIVDYLYTNAENIKRTAHLIDFMIQSNFYLKGGKEMTEVESCRRNGYFLSKVILNDGRKLRLARNILTLTRKDQLLEACDEIMRAYMYVGQSVPNFVMDILAGENASKEYLYAFAAGLLGAYHTKNQEKDETNE